MAQGAIGFMEVSAHAETRGGLAAPGLGSDSGWGLDWKLLVQVSWGEGPA